MSCITRLYRTLRPTTLHHGAARRQAARCRRFAVELLEGRQMLSTFTVTSNADTTAAGTLRSAITESNATPATAAKPNLINFNLPSSDQKNGV